MEQGTGIANFIAALLPELAHLGLFGYWIVLLAALAESKAIRRAFF